MASPWEKYQQPAQDGPWAKYRQAAPVLPDSPGQASPRADDGHLVDGWKPGIARDVMGGARSVIQGVGGLVGALGGDAFNYYLVPGDQPSYRDAAAGLADRMGLPKPQTAKERVLGDVGEALTGTALTMGAGGALASGGRAAVTGAPTGAQRVGNLFAAQPGLQAISTVTGAGSAGIARESGAGQGAQVAAGLIGAIAPSAARIGIPEALGGALSRSVPEQRKALARQANEMGIDLTPAQLSDSRFMKWAQSMFRSVPFTGAQGRYQRQVGQFNRQLAREIGEEARGIDSEVYARARDRQSALFDELTDRNAIKVDDQLVKSLSNIAEGSRMGGDQIRNQVESAIDALYSQATTGPGGVVIPGRAYQAFDSELNSIIKNGGPTAYYLGNVQSAVRRAMDKSITPRDAAAWRELRREYGSRKTLTALASKSNETGTIPPAQVLGAVTSTKAGKEAMASGRKGNIGDLARIGQLLKEPPSSGTAERTFVGTLLGAGAYMDPVTGTLTAAGLNMLSRGMDSKSLARLMVKENPGLTLEVAERIIARSLVPSAVSVPGEG